MKLQNTTRRCLAMADEATAMKESRIAMEVLYPS